MKLLDILSLKGGYTKAILYHRIFFLIGAEGLSTLITIQGLRPSRAEPTISYLLFAEDSLVFCKASLAEISIVERSCLLIGKLSYLLFVDDSLVFCKASLEEISIVEEVLSTYGKA